MASLGRITTTFSTTSRRWISNVGHSPIRKCVAFLSQKSFFSTASPLRHSDQSQKEPVQTNISNPTIHTVNKDEIAKFAAMSDEWWAPQGPFKMLHLMNPPRIRYIRNRLEASGAIPNIGMTNVSDREKQGRYRFPLQGLSILDVGCGGGLLSEALARLGATVTGLDASNENIQMATIHSKKDPLLNGDGPGSVTYCHQTAEQLLEQGAQFDVVCSLEVIEHVDNPAGFLKVLGELLKPNGDLILSTISRTPFSYLVTVFFAEHLLRMVPVGTHHWSKFIIPDELKAGVQDLAKCQVLNVQGIGFNPLSGHWELTDCDQGVSNNSAVLSSLAQSANYLLSAKKISS